MFDLLRPALRLLATNYYCPLSLLCSWCTTLDHYGSLAERKASGHPERPITQCSSRTLRPRRCQSSIHPLCLASTDNLDGSLRGMASTPRFLPWHTIPFSHYWQLGPMTLSSVLERYTSTAKSESLRLSPPLEGLRYDSYGFTPTNS